MLLEPRETHLTHGRSPGDDETPGHGLRNRDQHLHMAAELESVPGCRIGWEVQHMRYCTPNADADAAAADGDIGNDFAASTADAHCNLAEFAEAVVELDADVENRKSLETSRKILMPWQVAPMS